MLHMYNMISRVGATKVFHSRHIDWHLDHMQHGLNVGKNMQRENLVYFCMYSNIHNVRKAKLFAFPFSSLTYIRPSLL